MATVAYSWLAVSPIVNVGVFPHGDETLPAIAALPDGRWFLALQDGTNGVIDSQVFGPTGAPVTPIATPGAGLIAQSLPRAAALSDGRVAVVFAAAATATAGAATMLEMFNADGSRAPIGGSFTPITIAGGNAFLSSPVADVVGLKSGPLAGGFVTVAQVGLDAATYIRMELYDVNANLFETVQFAGLGSAGGPRVAQLDNGTIAVAFAALGGAVGPRVELFSFVGGVLTVTAEVLVDFIGLSADQLAITALAGGGFAVAYRKPDSGGVGTDVYAAVLNDFGGIVNGPFRVNAATAGNQFSPAITALSNGFFTVGWTTDALDVDGFPTTNGLTTTYDSNGFALPGAADLVTAFDANNLTLTALGGGTIASGWNDPANQVAPAKNVYVQETALVRTTDGTAASETLTGDGLRDVINGNGGNDTMRGLGGDDTLTGGAGNDTLYGGAGNDTLVGGGGVNGLDGGAGADALTGTGGVSYAVYWDSPIGVTVNLLNAALNTGDAAGDTYVGIKSLQGSTFADALTGDNQGDVIYGLGGADVINGGTGTDFFYGGAGGDALSGGGGTNYLDGGAGGDALIGTGGASFAVYWDAPAGVTVNLLNRLLNTGDAQGDTYIGITRLHGSFFADNLTADNQGDFIYGLDGADVITGGTGIDTLYGNAGADTLIGGGGVNGLDGGAGGDTLNGTGGISYAVYWDSPIGVTVNLLNTALNTGDAQGDIYVGINRLQGSFFADTLTANNQGGVIYGLAGADTITGGTGNDVFYGGAGADTLTGGGGADLFAYSLAGEGGDTITDFTVAQGDVILVSHTGFGGGLAASGFLNAAEFVNGAAATAGFGQFLWNAGAHTLSWDVDGTGAAAPVVIATLTGVTALAAGQIQLM